MNLPIVFIHKGDSFYLPYSLMQAKIANKSSELYLIGDRDNSYYKLIHHDYIDKYLGEALLLADIYKHLSPNPHNYELFCFQRWFVLKNFMQANNIQQCAYFDSDIMLYVDMKQEQSKFANFDFAVTDLGGGNPSSSFFNKQSTLAEYCKFVIDSYSKPEMFAAIELIFKEKKAKGNRSGISDMTFFVEFAKSRRTKVGQTSQIIDDSVYDRNINVSEGFEMDNGIKKVYWLNNEPYGKYLDSNKLIKFNALHFQGKAKKNIKDYFTGSKFAILSLKIRKRLNYFNSL